MLLKRYDALVHKIQNIITLPTYPLAIELEHSMVIMPKLAIALVSQPVQ